MKKFDVPGFDICGCRLRSLRSGFGGFGVGRSEAWSWRVRRLQVCGPVLAGSAFAGLRPALGRAGLHRLWH